MLRRQRNPWMRCVAGFVSFTLIFSLIIPPQSVWAQSVMLLPNPGSMISSSAAYYPAMIKGLEINPQNPLEFDFIVDAGQTQFTDKAFRAESAQLVRYFLASLTTPEDQMWVNLSPDEPDRIIPSQFGQTEMGRDLLAQDYILKQLTSSLMFPENTTGAVFWSRIQNSGIQSSDVSDVLSKVWIVPERAVVYEYDRGAFVMDAHLKVMFESEYLSTEEKEGDQNSQKIIHEIIIPEIEREVNEGSHFANLRQIYNAMILATWYKQKLKNSLLGKTFVDKNKIDGVDHKDSQITQKIYEQYLEAFKTGAYDYIKEEYDPVTQSVIPRKYFSGGAKLKIEEGITDFAILSGQDQLALLSKAVTGPTQRVTVNVQPRQSDPAMSGSSLKQELKTQLDTLAKRFAIFSDRQMGYVLDARKVYNEFASDELKGEFVKSIAQIYRQSFRSFHEGAEEYVKDLLLKDGNKLFVAVREGDLKGYIEGDFTEDTVSLEYIAIPSGERRQGYGTFLLDFFFQEAKRQKADQVVWSSTNFADEFYLTYLEGHGYKQGKDFYYDDDEAYFEVNLESDKAMRAKTEEELYTQTWVLRTGGTLEMNAGEGRKSIEAIDILVDRHESQISLSRKAFDVLPDSTNLGPKQWNEIIKQIRQMIAEKKKLQEKFVSKGLKPGGIVITTGTDTVDQIALVLLLELAQETDFPIVLTAAAKPIDEKDSDAPDNFALALEVANNVQLPPLVYFAFAGKVHLASRIKKFIAGTANGNDSQDLQDQGGEFESYGEIVGAVKEETGELEINSWIYGFKLGVAEQSFISAQKSKETEVLFSQVEHVIVDANTPVQVVEDAAQRLLNLKRKGENVGLVIQGKVQLQSRQRKDEFIKVIEQLIQEQIPVFAGSRDTVAVWAPSGIMLLPKYITYAKARTKLSWLLGKGMDFDSIVSEMTRDYVGEVPPLSHFPKSHVYEVFPVNDYRQGSEVLHYYPGMDLQVITDAVRRLASTDQNQKKLYIYGFGDGNLPVGEDSLIIRVVKWLQKYQPRWTEEFLKIFQPNMGEVLLNALEKTFSILVATWTEDELTQVLSSFRFQDFYFMADFMINQIIRDLPLDQKRQIADNLNILVSLIETKYPVLKGRIEISEDKGDANIGTIKKLLSEALESLTDDELKQFTRQEPKWLAQRLIKNSLMESSPLLRILGEATDSGINVEVRTKAYRSKTDTKAYELGNMLLAVGVNSQVVDGWKPVLVAKESTADAAMMSDASQDDFEGVDISPAGHEERIDFYRKKYDARNRVKRKFTNKKATGYLKGIFMRDREAAFDKFLDQLYKLSIRTQIPLSHEYDLPVLLQRIKEGGSLRLLEDVSKMDEGVYTQAVFEIVVAELLRVGQLVELYDLLNVLKERSAFIYLGLSPSFEIYMGALLSTNPTLYKVRYYKKTQKGQTSIFDALEIMESESNPIDLGAAYPQDDREQNYLMAEAILDRLKAPKTTVEVFQVMKNAGFSGTRQKALVFLTNNFYFHENLQIAHLTRFHDRLNKYIQMAFLEVSNGAVSSSMQVAARVKERGFPAEIDYIARYAREHFADHPRLLLGESVQTDQEVLEEQDAHILLILDEVGKLGSNIPDDKKITVAQIFERMVELGYAQENQKTALIQRIRNKYRNDPRVKVRAKNQLSPAAAKARRELIESILNQVPDGQIITVDYLWDQMLDQGFTGDRETNLWYIRNTYRSNNKLVVRNRSDAAMTGEIIIEDEFDPPLVYLKGQKNRPLEILSVGNLNGGNNVVALDKRDQTVVRISKVGNFRDTEEYIKLLKQAGDDHITPRYVGYGYTQDGRPYYQLEFVLGKVIEKSQIFTQIELEALKSLFKKLIEIGYLAHDIKSTNIMLGTTPSDRKYQAYLVDMDFLYDVSGDSVWSNDRLVKHYIQSYFASGWDQNDPNGELVNYIASFAESFIDPQEVLEELKEYDRDDLDVLTDEEIERGATQSNDAAMVAPNFLGVYQNFYSQKRQEYLDTPYTESVLSEFQTVEIDYPELINSLFNTYFLTSEIDVDSVKNMIVGRDYSDMDVIRVRHQIDLVLAQVIWSHLEQYFQEQAEIDSEMIDLRTPVSRVLEELYTVIARKVVDLISVTYGLVEEQDLLYGVILSASLGLYGEVLENRSFEDAQQMDENPSKIRQTHTELFVIWKFLQERLDFIESSIAGYGEQNVATAFLQAGDDLRESSGDAAMVVEEAPGGIDLNPARLNLHSSYEHAPFILPEPSPDLIEQMNRATGLAPVILNVTPIANLPLLLGLADPAESQPVADAELIDNSLDAVKKEDPELILAGS